MEKAVNQMYGQQKWKQFLDKKKPADQIEKENEKKAIVDKLLKLRMHSQSATQMKAKLMASLG